MGGWRKQSRAARLPSANGEGDRWWHAAQRPKVIRPRVLSASTCAPAPRLRATAPGDQLFMHDAGSPDLVLFLDHAHDAGVVCRNPRSGHSRMHITLETDTPHTETCFGHDRRRTDTHRQRAEPRDHTLHVPVLRLGDRGAERAPQIPCAIRIGSFRSISRACRRDSVSSSLASTHRLSSLARSPSQNTRWGSSLTRPSFGPRSSFFSRR